MQSSYPERFERDMGCTEAEWLMWLPAALGERAWTRQGQGASVAIPPGTLNIRWTQAEPRKIALARIPRLFVDFAFSGLDETQRLQFMKRFDLYMQRGGG
jgi:hypothetical protein